jgi:hypothetical protein
MWNIRELEVTSRNQYKIKKNNFKTLKSFEIKNMGNTFETEKKPCKRRERRERRGKREKFKSRFGFQSDEDAMMVLAQIYCILHSMLEVAVHNMKVELEEDIEQKRYFDSPQESKNDKILKVNDFEIQTNIDEAFDPEDDPMKLPFVIRYKADPRAYKAAKQLIGKNKDLFMINEIFLSLPTITLEEIINLLGNYLQGRQYSLQIHNIHEFSEELSNCDMVTALSNVRNFLQQQASLPEEDNEDLLNFKQTYNILINIFKPTINQYYQYILQLLRMTKESNPILYEHISNYVKHFENETFKRPFSIMVSPPVVRQELDMEKCIKAYNDPSIGPFITILLIHGSIVENVSFDTLESVWKTILQETEQVLSALDFNTEQNWVLQVYHYFSYQRTKEDLCNVRYYQKGKFNFLLDFYNTGACNCECGSYFMLAIYNVFKNKVPTPFKLYSFGVPQHVFVIKQDTVGNLYKLESTKLQNIEKLLSPKRVENLLNDITNLNDGSNEIDLICTLILSRFEYLPLQTILKLFQKVYDIDEIGKKDNITDKVSFIQHNSYKITGPPKPDILWSAGNNLVKYILHSLYFSESKTELLINYKNECQEAFRFLLSYSNLTY